MKPKEQILKFIQRAYEDTSQPNASEGNARAGNIQNQNEIIQELFDGMSTGTARIIIDQEISQAIGEEYDIDHLTNKGRYYLAKVVRYDGSPIQKLLVDKQTGSVQMIGR